MARLLLENGFDKDQIILDELSKDTLSSVRNCCRIIAGLPDITSVIVCSDVYHIPRCRWLFYLFGVSTVPGKVANGRSENKLSRWIYYSLREVTAIPWDTIEVLVFRARGPKAG